MNAAGVARLFADFMEKGSRIFPGDNANTKKLIPAEDDTAMEFGNGTYSFDVKVYGNTASDYFQWDASAGTLTLAGAAILNVPNGQLQSGSVATSFTSLASGRGAGVDTAESYATQVMKVGTLYHTVIVLDMTTLIGSATDLDIIGESAAASCHWGQLTTAQNGTLIGGQVTCLEVPAGGTADIDFYSSNVSTGTQDVIITDAALGTETALVTSGGAWTSGASKGMTALPTANDYIYIVNGAAAGGTFSAGKFKIEFFGYGA